jgi:hypothetical protein
MRIELVEVAIANPPGFVVPLLFVVGAGYCAFVETNAGIATNATPSTAHMASCKNSLLLLLAFIVAASSRPLLVH